MLSKKMAWALSFAIIAYAILHVQIYYPTCLFEINQTHSAAFAKRLKDFRTETKHLDGSIQKHSYLLVGGTGFTGTYLAEDLIARGAKKVSILSRKIPAPGKRLSGVHYIAGSITNETSMVTATEGISVVFHLVAYYGNPTFGYVDKKERQRAEHINIGGMKNTLSACQKNNVKLLIYTSSMDVTFDGSGGFNVTEDRPYVSGGQTSHYIETKAKSEEIALSTDNPSGLRVIAFRPGGIYGPRENFFSKKMLMFGMLTGYHPLYITPTIYPHQVDMTFVYNIAHAHML